MRSVGHNPATELSSCSFRQIPRVNKNLNHHTDSPTISSEEHLSWNSSASNHCNYTSRKELLQIYEDSMKKYSHPHDVILLGISTTLCGNLKAEVDLPHTHKMLLVPTSLLFPHNTVTRPHALVQWYHSVRFSVHLGSGPEFLKPV